MSLTRSPCRARLVVVLSAAVLSIAGLMPLPSEAQPPSLALEVVTQGLGTPVAVTHAGDERLFIALLDGRILVWDGVEILAAPFLDIGALASQGPERGLFSVAFHPNYAQNGLIFVSYTDLAGNSVLARYEVSGNPAIADEDSAVILLNVDQPQANHNGGQLQFGPQGYLYLGLGDGGGGNDPLCNAQRDGTLLGKMLRLDVDTSIDTPPFFGIPADNPFVGDGGPGDEVWALGLRNPWRFSFDRQTGDLFIGDVGQSSREEVNFQPASSRGGENYGWARLEGTLCINAVGACPDPVPACTATSPSRVPRSSTATAVADVP